MGTLRKALKNPGLVVSGGAHVLALVFLLVSFSRAPKFEDSIETVPVEMITTSELNEITNGEKTAKLMPKPQRRVDKVAELEEHKPAPPTPEAKKDTPPLPSPDKMVDDPGHDEKPPEPVAALPPPRPVAPPPPVREAPPVPTPPARPVAKVDAPTPPPKPDDVKPPPPDAEAIAAPKPPPRPKPPKETPPKQAKDEPKPVPPARPVEKVAKVVPPAPPKRPEPAPEPAKPDTLVDDVAKLLDKLKPTKPVSKPRSGNEVKEARSHDDFSLDKITALLDHDAPQRKQSTGRALAQVASLGSPTAHAEKMSPSMAAQLDGWLIDHYRGCWSYFGLGAAQNYVPQLRIRMAQDGSLMGEPSLLNPPSDPNLKSLADSAIRAVNRCNPMDIPERFRPYYDQGYKQRVIRFDPKEMS